MIGVDADPKKVAAFRQGRAPVYELGLEELLRANRDRVSGTLEFEQAVQQSDVTFLVVPAPSEPDGGFSLREVLDAGNRLGEALRRKVGFHRSSDTPHMCTLNALQTPLPTPCLVMMDVEGCEMDVLQGAGTLLKRSWIRWIIETHSQLLEQQCLERLRRAGLTPPSPRAEAAPAQSVAGRHGPSEHDPFSVNRPLPNLPNAQRFEVSGDVGPITGAESG